MKKPLLLSLICFSLSINAFAQGDCVITNVNVDASLCVNGEALFTIDFDVENPQGDVFGVVGNATNYGFFMYEDLPIVLGPLPGDGVTDYQFIIYDLAEPNCQYTFAYGAFDCCRISDVVVDQIVCTGSTSFRARVNFLHSNTGGTGFQVFSSTGTNLGTYQYSQLPVTVMNIPSFRNGPTTIRICDIGSTNCCTVVQFQDPDCNKTDCEIYNLDVDTLGCDNGEFSVRLDFDHMLGGPNFTVATDGTTFGPFLYTSLPLTLGPFPGDGTDYSFVVDGAGTGNHCGATYDLGEITCPPGCGFEDVVIDPMICQTDDVYSVFVSFVPITPGPLGFSAYADGEFLGSFEYTQVPFVIDSFPASGGFFDELTLCDNADTSCCFAFDFRALFCQACLIEDIELNPTVCDSLDQFYIDIDFYYYNQGEDFSIGGTLGFTGPYSYDSLPVRIGPFNGDSMSFFEFFVVDNDDPICFNGGELGVVDCDCTFENVSVDTLVCTGNGLYSLLLNFTPVEVTHQRFEVYAGDVFIGSYRYNDLPVTITDFPASGGDLDEITICDANTPTCCVSYQFEGMYCTCEISNLAVVPSTCDTANGVFDLDIDFDWIGLPAEFTVYLNELPVGTITGANLPVTLEDLATNIGTANLRVCGNGHPDCCSSVEFENPCEGPCEISNFSVNVSDCDSVNNSFSATIDFDWIGEVDGFEISMGDVVIGSVGTDDLPVTIPGLMTFGGNVVFSVVALDRPDCNTSLELTLQECRFIPCVISELNASHDGCNSDTTFGLNIAYSYQGFNEDSVSIRTTTDFIGVFSVTQIPLHINAFPWNGEQEVTLIVCENGNAFCCDTVVFIPPYCGCEVTGIQVTPGECNEDFISFPAEVNIQWQGDVQHFVVYTGSQLLGVFEASQLPDTILAFPLPDGELAEITVCADGDSTCCLTQSFVAPTCDTTFCSIEIASVDTFQCTGESVFSSWLEYTAEGFSGAVNVWANDVSIGEYQQFHPILLFNIPEAEDSIIIRVCSVEDPDCCDEFTIQSMFCPDAACFIDDLTAAISEPDSSGEFAVTLDFDFDNEGPAFTVSGNGNQYGVYTYNNVPLTLTEFLCDSTTEWQFVVQDLLNPTCLDFVNLGIVPCDTVINSVTAPQHIALLDIFYGPSGTSFVMPESGTEFLLWTADGKLMQRRKDFKPGERVFLDPVLHGQGLYFIQIRTPKLIYAGKVVHLR